MPYFIHKIMPPKLPVFVEVHEKFKDAKLKAREMRQQQAETEDYTVKITFAKDQTEAEELILTPREPQVKREDD